MSRTTDRPTHSIRVVAERTGLTLDVIRVWERRYQAVVPERLESGRRLYSDAQVSRLVMLRRATEQGLRIRDAARADEAELERFLAKHDAANSATRVAERAQRAAAADHLRSCIESVREMNPDKLDNALMRAQIVLPVNILLEAVLGPLMTWIGDEWSSGKLAVAHEKMASAALRSFLTKHTQRESRKTGQQSLLVTTPAGQTHELGALMVAMACAAKGWRVEYPGPNVSAEDIVTLVRRTNPRLLALSIVYPESDPATADELRKIRQGLGPNAIIVVGGRASSGHAEAIAEIGAIHCESVARLAEALDALQGSAGDEREVTEHRPFRGVAASH